MQSLSLGGMRLASDTADTLISEMAAALAENTSLEALILQDAKLSTLQVTLVMTIF